VNTAYYELGLEVGPSAVAELAHRAGIPDDVPLVSPDGTTNGSISLGGYEVHVIDQAVGFATFANAGVPTGRTSCRTSRTATAGRLHRRRSRR
jgi:membrane peptidoglycan carboxypeptidase